MKIKFDSNKKELDLAIESIPKLEEAARAPFLVELRVKEALINKFKAREKELMYQFRTLRMTLKYPRMYN